MSPIACDSLLFTINYYIPTCYLQGLVILIIFIIRLVCTPGPVNELFQEVPRNLLALTPLYRKLNNYLTIFL